MSGLPRPASIVAERAVRFLREHGRPVDSRRLAGEVLATKSSDETTARRVLQAAFASDPRLVYRSGKWTLADPEQEPERTTARPEAAPPQDVDRVVIVIRGEPQGRGTPFKLKTVSALRLRDDEVVSACGGDVVVGPAGERLRRAILEALDDAVPVIHDQPGALGAFEAWLNEPLDAPISLRRLARERLGLPARHDPSSLMGRLELRWRESDDPLEQADALDACLQALRREGESLHDLRVGLDRGTAPIDWARFSFNREFLTQIPQVPGTYQFFDDQGRLLYVGKSKNLHTRIGSYFREGVLRSPRIQKLLDSVYRIEYEHTYSDLEATLREAELIRSQQPQKNIQRNVDTRRGYGARLHSILILEPAAPPAILRAYLIRKGQFIDRVAIGPRGGGLRRIERVLEDYYFSGPVGPTHAAGPDLAVEVVVRWLAANRDQAVAFDPTDLGSAREVIERLRWFLDQGGLFDPDGTPIITR